MKTLAIFGGSGQTGKEFLDKALSKGYQVRALVRNPVMLERTHPNLTVIKGDVLNQDHVEETVAGSDVVVSLFGHVKGSPAWLQTNGTRNIVEAMKKHHVDRIISLSGGGLPYPEQDRPKVADKMIRTIMKIAVPKMLNDAIQHHEVLKTSGVKWTIVRGPRLLNVPEKDTYRVGWVGVNASTSIGRKDLASFVIKVVEDESFTFQMPFVSY